MERVRSGGVTDMTTSHKFGVRAWRVRSLIFGGSCLSFLGLAIACAPAPTSAPNPTVQAQPTTQAQPTISAAETQIVTSVQGVATAVAPTAQSVQTAAVGIATRVVPTVAPARTDVAPTVAPAGTTGAGTAAPTVYTAATTGAGTAAPTVYAAGTTGVGAAATSQTPQATNVTMARDATATVLAPTAQAVATRVAPTVQAAATQSVATQGAPAVGTSVANSPVHVTNVNVGSTDTIVAIQNTGATPLTLTGWTLVMGPDLSIQLSDITLNAGQTRQLHFSQGSDTDSDVYLGPGSTNVARSSLQPGTHVVLIAPTDQIASVYPVS